ncbi:autophagy-related protein 27, partial [Blastocladiella britannica]
DLAVSTDIPSPPSKTALTYRVNLCKPLGAPADATEACASGSLLCQVLRVTPPTADAKPFVYSVVPLVSDPNALPQLTYTPPAAGGAGEVGSTLSLVYAGKNAEGAAVAMTVVLECAAAGSTTDPLTIGSRAADGSATLRVRSAAACPQPATPGGNGGDGKPAPPTPPAPDTGNGGGGGFGTFLGWVVFLFIGYLIVGTLYRRFVLKITGLEQVPHYEFWVSLPGLAMELFRTIKAKLTGQQRGYIQV